MRSKLYKLLFSLLLIVSFLAGCNDESPNLNKSKNGELNKGANGTENGSSGKNKTADSLAPLPTLTPTFYWSPADLDGKSADLGFTFVIKEFIDGQTEANAWANNNIWFKKTGIIDPSYR